jgi:hypothetical protein
VISQQLSLLQLRRLESSFLCARIPTFFNIPDAKMGVLIDRERHTIYKFRFDGILSAIVAHFCG